ncbi:hypothetical protein BU17DRAFT_79204 [Hysterangium stoloniferum]|nr:hypothetical protein BU17DRAFT_79204 [Hysterangium stoloniferum]
MAFPEAGTSVDFCAIFGPIYWGFVFSLLLGGITILQGYIYFTRSNDSLSIRLAAASMIILDMLSSALIAQSVYYYLIPHFGSAVPLDGITPELSAECLVATTITLISQLFFTRQLYAVTSPLKNPWSDPIMLITLIIDSALRAPPSWSYTTILFLQTEPRAFRFVFILSLPSDIRIEDALLQIFFGLAKGFGALTDIIATIAMCTVLASVRGGISRTNSLINTLIHFVIRRGGLVTLIQTLLLVMFFAEPTRLYWLAFHVNVTKLYTNTFFAMLNSRERMKQKDTDPTSSFNNCSGNLNAHIEGGSLSVHPGSVHDSSFVQNYETAPKSVYDADSYRMCSVPPVKHN